MTLGLSEVARIRGEMEKVKEAAGFKGTLEEFFVFMRTDKRFYLPNNDAGAAEYIKLADGYLKGMKAKLPEYFGILPKAELVVQRVEAFREQPGAAQHYMRATPDGSRPGIFYAHLSDMNAMPTYQLENIAYHEGLPGHHMQISIQQELTGIPKFRTQYGYAAYLGRLGALFRSAGQGDGLRRRSLQRFRQTLVARSGARSGWWWIPASTRKAGHSSRREDYFKANSAQPEQAIKSEVERYILNPGQATSYKIGMITIQKLRDEAKAALGDKFRLSRLPRHGARRRRAADAGAAGQSAPLDRSAEGGAGGSQGGRVRSTSYL